MATHASSAARHPQPSVHAFGYAIAALMGAAAGIFFTSSKGKQITTDLTQKAKALANHYRSNRAELQQSVQDIFGEVTDDLERLYVETRGFIMAGIDALGAEAHLTKEKYKQIVKDAVDTYTRDRDLSATSTRKLARHFEDEWDNMKRE